LRNFGITDIHLGTPDKVETFKEYAELYNINPEHVLYGRRYSDFHVMKLIGLPTCPKDSSPEIKSILLLHRNGARKARSATSLSKSKVQGKWMSSFDARLD
jgi:3-deoxy-D-manno-octulosonate 8-phosphate phosphatase (KDO 8-P phosphatase)